MNPWWFVLAPSLPLAVLGLVRYVWLKRHPSPIRGTRSFVLTMSLVSTSWVTSAGSQIVGFDRPLGKALMWASGLILFATLALIIPQRRAERLPAS